MALAAHPTAPAPPPWCHCWCWCHPTQTGVAWGSAQQKGGREGAMGGSCKGWWGWGGGQRGIEMFWGKSQGVWGAEHRLFPAMGALPCRIRPPPCPLQSSLLRDLMMHPRSPGRQGAPFSPLPHSLMVLCNQLIPASQVEAAPTCSQIPHVQPRWLHASPLHRGPPACPMHPQLQPGIQLHAGLSLSFLGETTGEQGSQRHLGSPMPLTPPQPSKRQTDHQDTRCPLATLPRDPPC